MQETVDGEPESLGQDLLILVLHIREVMQHPTGSGSKHDTIMLQYMYTTYVVARKRNQQAMKCM
jgi:hypothetical protein